MVDSLCGISAVPPDTGVLGHSGQADVQMQEPTKEFQGAKLETGTGT